MSLLYATEYYTINRCLIIDIYIKVTSENSRNLREISDFAFNENVEKFREIWRNFDSEKMSNFTKSNFRGIRFVVF